jgi:HD-like signal output (HDOD) protein
MRLGIPGQWIDLAEEDRKFNADHCVVGYLVARHWHLPEFICDAIRYHHAIGELGRTPRAAWSPSCNWRSRSTLSTSKFRIPEWKAVSEEVLPELGLNEDALPELIDIVLERFHGACSRLNEKMFVMTQC